VRLFLLLVAGLLGCPADHEPAPSLIAEARRAAEGKQGVVKGGPSQQRERPKYIPNPGIHIHMPAFAGKRYADLAPEFIAWQLGDIVGREELPHEQEHIKGTKAECWLYRGKVYRVRKPLEHLMDISTALGTSGFPLSLGEPVRGIGEIRWVRAMGMRWVRLETADSDPRLYDVIEVEAFSPWRKR
jgi:hypothetical protein